MFELKKPILVQLIKVQKM